MYFANSITRTPFPYDQDRGADMRQAAPWATGGMADLLSGTAGCSPYLSVLIQRETTWLETAVYSTKDPLTDLYAELRNTAPDALGAALRQAKRRVALWVALADLGGVWPLEQVTQSLTDFADLSTSLAFQASVGAEIRRKKLPGATEGDVPTAGGLVAFAMGKMGAGELNYSSDIDLICLFDETRYDPADFHDARASLVRATRKAAALMNDVTGDGYVFRTDLRLRPDPAVTPVCLAMEAAERYYESLGRTWERAAWIKARPCAGDLAAGERFQHELRPFVWRRHLDFAAIEDAHNMRLAIREHKGLGGDITLPGHNMKLGRGGIREIEFFTQTRQLIAGGRDPDLRVRGTADGLSVLSEKGWIPSDVAAVLTQHYRHHRDVEHRLQMIQDAQTHSLPNSDEGFDRLAAFMGTTRAALQRDLHDRLEEVHVLTESFFSPDTQNNPAESDHGDDENDLTARWRTYPCLRSERAVAIFKRLTPDILRRLQAAARPEEALQAFEGFLERLPAGVQVFSLFEANPHLVDLLIDIVATSPDLGHHLARNAAVLDAVIGGDFFAPWPGRAALEQDLQAIIAQESDYESCLDAARRWGKEWHFRIGVHLLRGLCDASEAGAQYSDLAEAALAGLWPRVQTEFARKHGPVPGRGAAVLGMGSLGAGRLHARSDLDLIVIYDPDGVDMSEGPRPLAARAYYARLTQALVTAMSANMSQGRLYEIDMRLRPSGNAGPVATSLESYRNYQRNDAWLWEHLALNRARVIVGPESLAADIDALRHDILSAPHDRAKVAADLSDMRRRIAEAKGKVGALEPKIGAGRLQDIDLVAQAGALIASNPTRRSDRALARAAECGWMTPQTARSLSQAHDLFWALQTGARLITAGAAERDTLGGGGAAFLCRLSGQPTLDALERHVAETAETAARHIDSLLSDGTEP